MHSPWTLCAGFAMILLTGCLTGPTHETAPPRLDSAALGTIGIISTSNVPNLSWQLPLTKATATQEGLELGWNLGAPTSGMTHGFLQGTAGFGLPLPAAAALTTALFGTIHAPRKTQLYPADDAITVAVRQTDLQESLRAAVLRRTTGTPGHFGLVQKPFPPGQETDYRRMASMMCATLASLPRDQKPLTYLKSAGFDTALEIELKRTSLEGNGSINPRMRLTIAGVARVIDLPTGRELASAPFCFSSSKHNFTGWGGNNAELLRSELSRAFVHISDEIVGKLFRPGRALDKSNDLIAASFDP